jgi:hypothetical protein
VAEPAPRLRSGLVGRHGGGSRKVLLDGVDVVCHLHGGMVTSK